MEYFIDVEPQGICTYIWAVVKIMVPFWIPIIIRYLRFFGTPKGTII